MIALQGHLPIASNGSGGDVALIKLWRTRSVMLLVKKVRTTKLN